MDAFNRTVARGISLFLGGFTLLNAIGGLGRRYFDANQWWIDLRPLPGVIVFILLCGGGAALVALGLRADVGIIRRRISVGFILILVLAAAVNCVAFAVLLARREIRSEFPVPFSLFILLALIFVLWSLLLRQTSPVRPRRVGIVLTFFACVLIFPLGQMFCFGLTDYRRPADAIVVFGAHAHANGQPSDALADRVRCACELYHQGLAPVLIFSGGPGDGPVHETEAMRRMAISLGVPDSAIVCDLDGLNTADTVADTVPMLKQMGAKRVLAVSHFYHLPRIKLSYSRAGVDVFTVPASQARTLKGMPKWIGREVFALCEYYADPLLPEGMRTRS